MHSAATNYGLYAADRFTNTGTITGPGGLLFGGGGYFSNYGTVTGTTANGVHLIGGATNIYNAFGAVITGAATGLYTTDDSTILNEDKIQGYHNDGIDVRGNGDVTNNGIVLGNIDGVALGHGLVSNSGGIVGNYGAGVSIAANGVVANGSSGLIDGGIGVLVGSGYGDVYNRGLILGNTAVNLASAVGYVNNVSGGYIDGTSTGVVLTGNLGSSQIENSGTIGGRDGSGVYVYGTRSNTQVYIDNAGGTINGYSGVTGYGNTLVTNFGTINGHSGTGVRLFGNTYVENLARGTITGEIAGVSLYGTHGGVANNGTITSANNGVVLGTSGTVTNAGGMISGLDGAGVLLLAGGSVKNSPSGGHSGSIYGRYYGILAAGTGTASVTNTGQIEGRSSGIDLRVTGTVVNNGGTIVGVLGSGVVLEAGGSVKNTVTAGQRGRIIGLDGIHSTGSSISVTNSADIFGVQVGVHLLAGGTVTNQAGGDINGPTGILVSGGNATVTDAGTIFGTNYAVQFTGGGNDRLILDPGGVVSGTVSGAGARSTLELAAGTSTITGLGSQFLGFGQVGVDRTANWTLTNANSLQAGSTLAVSRTLTASGSLVDGGKATIAGTLRTSGTGAVRFGQGVTMSAGSVLAPGSTGSVEVGGAGGAKAGVVTVDSGATLRGTGSVSSAVTDNGTVEANGTLSITGSLTGSGLAKIDSHSVLSVTGALGTARMQFLSGGNETAVLGSPTAVTAVTSGFAATDTLDLVGFVANHLSFVSDTLTVSRASGAAAKLSFSSAYSGHHFAMASDGHGGTNISIV